MSSFDAALAALAWQLELGADEAIGPAPVNRFALRRAAPSAAAAPPAAGQSPSPAFPPPSPDPGPADGGAAALAAAARDLAGLRRALEGFEGCALKRGARRTVFADGNPAARVMVIGEAPGRDEDIEGRPFVGRSGQLLDRMLNAIGYSRNHNAYIANVIYWRPPGNRDPSDVEVAICRPFILRQIELIGPALIVFLGAQPAKALLGGEAVKQGINKLRGRWCELEIGNKRFKALPTFHPAYLLRTPIKKREAWRDFLTAKVFLENGGRLPPG